MSSERTTVTVPAAVPQVQPDGDRDLVRIGYHGHRIDPKEQRRHSN